MDPSRVQSIKVKLLKPVNSTMSQTHPIPAIIHLGVDPSTGEPLQPVEAAPTKSAATAAGARSKPQAKPMPRFGAKPPVADKKPAAANQNLQPPSAALKGLLNLFTSATKKGPKETFFELYRKRGLQ
eukprot:gene7581-7785_t